MSFYSKVIPASASEAPHVLDRLIYHESSVDIREHATDTAGAVEIIFAMFHLFDFRFTPRIRGLADRRLYVIDWKADYGWSQPLIGGFVDVERIRDN